MIDLDLVRTDPDRIKKAIQSKKAGDPIAVDNLLEADLQRRQITTQLQRLKEKLNAASARFLELRKSGLAAEALAQQGEIATIKSIAKDLEIDERRWSENTRNILLTIPNIPHESVPDYNSDGPEGNTVVSQSDPIEKHGLKLQPHWDIIKKHNLVDFERGSKVTGKGFPFYVGKGARLQRALISFFLDIANDRGYTEVQAPLLVNNDSAVGTGQLPDKEGQMYRTELDSQSLGNFVESRISNILGGSTPSEMMNVSGTPGHANDFAKEINDILISKLRNEIIHTETDPVDFKYYLIPTAEVPLTNFLRDEILSEHELPRMLAGYTPCFRREAGSYGKDVRGLNRLHQFDKVELVRFVHPEHSYAHLEKLTEETEDIINVLGLQYRRLLMCKSDLGFTPAKKYDLEVWSAGQARWLEVSSISNFEAYQARRANIRFRPAEGGKPQFVHTLNGSALALPRIVAALLENGQQADGSVVLPECLWSYTGFERIG